MKTWYIIFTKENVEKCKKRIKTHTRRVIEKIDHYKNIKPGDILITTKNRFSKEEVDRNEVVKTWTERVQDIQKDECIKEGIDITDYEKGYNNNDVTVKEAWSIRHLSCTCLF